MVHTGGPAAASTNETTIARQKNCDVFNSVLLFETLIFARRRSFAPVATRRSRFVPTLVFTARHLGVAVWPTPAGEPQCELPWFGCPISSELRMAERI
jgi:hypothetical protein